MFKRFDNFTLDLLREINNEFSDRGVDKNLDFHFSKDKNVKITIARLGELFYVKQFNLYDPSYSGGEVLFKTKYKTKAFDFFRKQKKLMKLMGLD